MTAHWKQTPQLADLVGLALSHSWRAPQLIRYCWHGSLWTSYTYTIHCSTSAQLKIDVLAYCNKYCVFNFRSWVSHKGTIYMAERSIPRRRRRVVGVNQFSRCLSVGWTQPYQRQTSENISASLARYVSEQTSFYVLSYLYALLCWVDLWGPY